VLEYSQQRVGTFLDDRGENIRESSGGQIILLAGSGNGVSIRESPLFFIYHTVVHTNTFYLHGADTDADRGSR
jgi:hypothetical protein